ncbi:MAG: AraC family transcriptional regulator [Colwellia sp.]|nr:AraC family transcriptional regulator [Colwellia sp.]
MNTNWIYKAPGEIERIEACFDQPAFGAHRHDTYAVGITLSGKQGFTYRGCSRFNEAGRSLIIHPDELHDGQPVNESIMHYRVCYIEPAKIQKILGGKSLPFIDGGISDDQQLYLALCGIFDDMERPLKGLEYEESLYDLAISMDRITCTKSQNKKRPDYKAAELAREYINANLNQTIDLETLEQISGRDRWKLTRDFRALFGTSPYRYLIMRRLERARTMLLTGTSAADAAIACNFSDQSHMNRHFKKTYGLTPRRLQTRLRQHR